MAVAADRDGYVVTDRETGVACRGPTVAAACLDLESALRARKGENHGAIAVAEFENLPVAADEPGATLDRPSSLR